MVTNANGIIKITGLKEGTYTFTEVQAPEGYNKLPNPITIVVESNVAEVVAGTASTFAWTTSSDDVSLDNGVFKFNVENNSGSTLPSTGGIGTTILYIIGGVMALLAVVFLITKRRVASSKKDAADDIL